MERFVHSSGFEVEQTAVPNLLEIYAEQEVELFGITAKLKDLAKLCPIDLTDGQVDIGKMNDMVVQAANGSGMEIAAEHEHLFVESTERLQLERGFRVRETDQASEVTNNQKLVRSIEHQDKNVALEPATIEQQKIVPAERQTTTARQDARLPELELAERLKAPQLELVPTVPLMPAEKIEVPPPTLIALKITVLVEKEVPKTPHPEVEPIITLPLLAEISAIPEAILHEEFARAEVPVLTVAEPALAQSPEKALAISKETSHSQPSKEYILPPAETTREAPVSYVQFDVLSGQEPALPEPELAPDEQTKMFDSTSALSRKRHEYISAGLKAESPDRTEVTALWADELYKEPEQLVADFAESFEAFALLLEPEVEDSLEFVLVASSEPAPTQKENTVELGQPESQPAEVIELAHEVAEKLQTLEPEAVAQAGLILRDIAGMVHGLALLESTDQAPEAIEEVTAQLEELCTALLEQLGIEVTPEKTRLLMCILLHEKFTPMAAEQTELKGENLGTHELKPDLPPVNQQPTKAVEDSYRLLGTLSLRQARSFAFAA